MEVISLSLNVSAKDVITIIPIGDIHAGSINCDENRIQDEVESIASMRNTYIIGMGDYCDAILKDDKRFDIGGLAPWLEQDNILESQRKWITKLFAPVKSKIICMLTGNHEETVHAHCQTDQTRNICSDLGVRYGGYSCFVNLSCIRGRGNTHNRYQVHAWHGAGAAQTEGARINRLMRLVNDVYADIYLMGHLHAITSHTPERLTCPQNKVKSQRLIATLTGSWLKAYQQSGDTIIPPSYAEKAGYKPTRIGAPRVTIKPVTGELNICI